MADRMTAALANSFVMSILPSIDTGLDDYYRPPTDPISIEVWQRVHPASMNADRTPSMASVFIVRCNFCAEVALVILRHCFS
jgi:hypothetical protein